MLQLVYASTAVHPMSPEDLRALLETARAKNERLGVTGMLLYRDEQFLQALEGEQQVVRRLYDTIRADDRHTHIITLRERLLEDRSFGEWTMGFRNLDEQAEDEWPEGFVPFMNGSFTPEHFRQNPGHAHRALLRFRDAARS